MTLPTVYLGLGSNLGDRRAFLELAVHRLAALPRFTLLRRSTLYQSRALGEAAGGEFLNGAVAGHWEASPRELLHACQAIELEGGRERPYKDAPRTLDIDILWWDGMEMSTPELTLPHPRLRSRAFALVPLLEILPRFGAAGNGEPLSSWLSTELLNQGIQTTTHSQAAARV